MPVKLGLVFNVQRQPNTLQRQPNTLQRQPVVKPQTMQNKSGENIQQQQPQQGINLRRIMNAPKTGCKSCGG